MTENTQNPEISVVIPLKDEEENVRPLLEELDTVLASLSLPSEVVAVDDGSTDGTWQALEACKAQMPRLRMIRLDRNYGQSTGFWAGMKNARGRIIVTMDGDMQNDPHDIPKLLSEIKKGADACLTIRANRQDTKWKKMQSRIGNGFRNHFLQSEIADTGSQLRAVKAEFIEDLPPFEGMHRFMGNLYMMRGCKIAQVNTNHRGRRSGTSKYNAANRAWRGLKDLFGVAWLRQRQIRYGVAQRKD